MSKKILLLSSVIFLSSCATSNISELGDKFLDLINPSDAATEEAILGGEETLVAMDQTGGFTIDELEALSNDELIAIAQEKGLEDLILLDEDGKVGKLYNAKTTPHMFIIAPNGNIIYQGAIDSIKSASSKDISGATNYVAEALDAHMAGKQVLNPITKPYGCSVKY